MAVQDPLCGVKGWAVIGCGDMCILHLPLYPFYICAFHVFHLTATLMADLLADDSF